MLRFLLRQFGDAVTYVLLEGQGRLASVVLPEVLDKELGQDVKIVLVVKKKFAQVRVQLSLILQLELALVHFVHYL